MLPQFGQVVREQRRCGGQPDHPASRTHIQRRAGALFPLPINRLRILPSRYVWCELKNSVAAMPLSSIMNPTRLLSGPAPADHTNTSMSTTSNPAAPHGSPASTRATSGGVTAERTINLLSRSRDASCSPTGSTHVLLRREWPRGQPSPGRITTRSATSRPRRPIKAASWTLLLPRPAAARPGPPPCISKPSRMAAGRAPHRSHPRPLPHHRREVQDAGLRDADINVVVRGKKWTR